jgi:hypothetical protein
VVTGGRLEHLIPKKTAIKGGRTRGVAGVTRREAMRGSTGDPYGCCQETATGGYKGDRNSIGSVSESEVPIVPL